ncbi:MAG: hypothetical protein NTW30_05645 [Candidatus Aenigmarchaeota archaeon]|nr:hypothetical protein [Candidatus Aenigmarchaeota archaeon]
MKANKTSTIKVAKKSDRPKATINKVIPMKDKMGKVKVGMRLTGKTVVPNLAAMKKRKIITSMD